VSITTSVEPADFEKDDVDFGICRMVPNDPNLRSELFALEELCLVVSPSLHDRFGPYSLPDYLSKTTWLIADTRPDMWRSWLEGMNLPDASSPEVQHFEQLNMAIQAAVAGLGVTVVPRLFVADDLKAGHLKALANQAVVSSQRYYLVYPEAKAHLPTVKALRDWLFEEIQSQKA
jgi:LysR family glycine cleavage system transcriptional activator